MTPFGSRARTLLVEFLGAHPNARREDFERLRSAHADVAQELDVLYDEVTRLREGLRFSPKTIVQHLTESDPVDVEDGAVVEERPERLGDFEVLEEIGRGGMGVVWKGRDPQLGRVVALKVLRRGLASKPESRRRFVVEARITGQLQHPGIVPVYEIGDSADGRPFLAMKFVKGETLKSLFAQRDAADFRQRFLSVFQRVCEAVAYAHARSVVHRDLKPSNVMIGSFGEVQVLDWGLAKVVGEPEPVSDESVVTSSALETENDPLSTFGQVVGTPAYMSPEQAQGQSTEVDPRADVFSLGAMLCEFLIGSPPAARGYLRASHPEGLAADHRRLRASGGERDLVELACASLAHDPGDRPRDAAVLAQAIARFRAESDERAAQATLEAAEQRARAGAEAKARRRTTVLGNALILSLLVAGATAFRSWDRTVRAASRSTALLEEAHALVRDGNYEGALLVTRSVLELGNVPPRMLAQLSLLHDYDELRRSASGIALDDIVHQRLSASYRAMFERYGLDPTEVEPERAAREFADPGLLPDMVVLLDEWARSERVVSGWDSLGAGKLLDLADRLDGSDARRSIRALIRQREPLALRALLSGPGPDTWSPSTLVGVLESIKALLPREQMGDISDAYQASHRVLARHAADVQVLLELASICMRMPAEHYVVEAYGHLRTALALGTSNPGTWILLGLVQQRLGDPGAEVSFERATEALDPEDEIANRLVSQLMGLSGLSPIVLAALERELAAEPDSVDLLCELGWHVAIFGSRGSDSERALRGIERARSLAPDDPRPVELLPMLLYRAGRPADCERAVRERASAGRATALLDVFRAMSLFELGRVEEARKLLGDARIRFEYRRAENGVFLEAEELLGR